MGRRPVWRILSLALHGARLAIALALLYVAWQWRSPLFTSVRLQALAALILIAIAVLAWDALLLWRRRGSRPARIAGAATALLAFAALVVTCALELHFRWQRHTVLNADPAQLVRLGRHLVVGYRSDDELRALVERRAIAGVFLSARNVHGKDLATLRREVDEWQAIRARQNLPPLLIATDQEGGAVSRLSPPLPRPATLAEIVRAHPDAAKRREAVRAYAAEVGRALADAGVNLNFAPVVDLDHGVVNPNDRHTRIGTRAVASDPQLVAEAARDYCEGLARAGVHCTLKHFPGLGRVFEDTHLEHASLKASVEELAQTDWLPFRALMRGPGVFTMLAHVRFEALDRERPASFSSAVVAGLVRGQWNHDGVLITDDFSMEAAYVQPRRAWRRGHRCAHRRRRPDPGQLRPRPSLPGAARSVAGRCRRPPGPQHPRPQRPAAHRRKIKTGSRRPLAMRGAPAAGIPC